MPVFGYVTANPAELTPEQKQRYRSIYCGICRSMGSRCGGVCRFCLTYDLVFLALTLSSLYEPEETSGSSRCLAHPLKRQSWQDSPIISYAADMNIALGYFSAKDNWDDDRKLPALALSNALGKHYPLLRQRYGRQCEMMEERLKELHRLEQENCPNPDLPANAFGQLLGECFVWKEDMWSVCLRNVGHSLGRFIYLADAAMDYDKDLRSGSYNPFIALGSGRQPERWKEYLTGEMARCTDAFRRLPLVQDKALLDNILYSGIWLAWGRKEKREHRRSHGNG